MRNLVLLFLFALSTTGRADLPCGPDPFEVSMRPVVQPKMDAKDKSDREGLVVLTSDAQEAFDGKPSLQFQIANSAKLSEHLKTHKFLSVVFTRKVLGLKGDPRFELTMCLIDGKPIDYWTRSRPQGIFKKSDVGLPP